MHTTDRVAFEHQVCIVDTGDMSDSTIIQGPDGRLYEIPNDRLGEFAVPGERVAELRRRMADKATAGSGNGHHAPMPPGHAPMPPASMSISPGGGVVLNFFFHAPPPPGPAPVSPPSEHSVEPYHMAFDESGIPVNHTEMLWGDYIDKQGNAAVGWHSHDPVTGNAQ